MAQTEASEDAQQGRGRPHAFTREPRERPAEEAGGRASGDSAAAAGAAGGQPGAQADAGAAQGNLSYAVLGRLLPGQAEETLCKRLSGTLHSQSQPPQCLPGTL